MQQDMEALIKKSVKRVNRPVAKAVNNWRNLQVSSNRLLKIDRSFKG